MADITRKLILTGGRAGATCQLRKLQFVEGCHTLRGPEKDVEGLTRYMGRCYKAFPEGSAELAHFQALDEERTNGAGEADTQPGSANALDPHAGNVQPTGTGPATGTDGAVGGDDPPATGSTEQHTSGDGPTGAGTTVQPQGENTLRQVILQLDPTDDELWTTGGQPRMDAVAAACGREDVTRKEVDAAVPGYLRPTS